MKGHLPAFWAELIDFHFGWVESFVTGGEVILFATLGAF